MHTAAPGLNEFFGHLREPIAEELQASENEQLLERRSHVRTFIENGRKIPKSENAERLIRPNH